MPNINRLQWSTAALCLLATVMAATALRLDQIDRLARPVHHPVVALPPATDHNPLTAVYLPTVRFSGMVPASFAASISQDLSRLPLDEKKAAFLKIVLPLVARENTRIRREREFLNGAADQVPEYLWEKYDVKKGDLETLRRRVDVIPASLVLAQAALESGWGTSRFAREGNNLFGVRTYNPATPGLSPDKADGFRVVKYPTLSDGVAHYMQNLNTNDAYVDFRRAREHMRAKGEDPDSHHLATRLTNYSEIPQTYGQIVRDIIDKEKLEDFDGIRLQGDEPRT